MAVTAIPRIVVKLGLGSVRLPLSIAERLGARSGLDLAGSPLVALYDELEGQAKQALGRWIADDQLIAEGRRQAGALQSRRDAAQEDEQDLEQRRAELRQEEEVARAEAEERAAQREEAVRRAARSRARANEARRRQRELARQRAASQPEP